MPPKSRSAPSEDPHVSIRLATATAEINTYLCEVGKVLDHERVTTRNTGPQQNWVLGYGYIILQKQIHRVEENFLLIALRPVLAEAQHDMLRLQDATIPNRDMLRSSLNSAATVLNAPQQDRPPHQPTVGVNLSATATLPTAEWMPKDELEAREVLQQVRRTINEFRDERRTGIVRARNRLLRTMDWLWCGSYTPL